MSQRLDCALDGVRLESLDSTITVTDIMERPAELELIRTRPALGDGTLVTGVRRTALRVDVTFTVRETSVLRRAMVLERIAYWSRGTVLTLNTRPERMLAVRCTRMPAQGSALDWSAPITMGFTASEIPWWQDAHPVTISLDSLEAPDSLLTVPGTADETTAEADVTCLEDGLTCVQLLCGETAIRLEGLTMNHGDVLRLSHDRAGRLRITANGISVLTCRTEDSDDELLAACGRGNPVHLLTDAHAKAIFSARGRYV